MLMASQRPRLRSIRNRRSRWQISRVHNRRLRRRLSPGNKLNGSPLGVWALAQEEKGDAYMFFQISIDKNGAVNGAYQNVLSGERSPISGQVDKKTQRVAWKIGSNNTVIETGLQNLTQDVASCLVHFGPDTTQTWLLVRLKQPEMPTAPQTASGETKES